MKHFKILTLLLILWVITSLELMAQIQMERTLFSSIGGSVNMSDYQIDYSIGEFKVGFHDMASYQVHEGFHQGQLDEISTSSDQVSLLDLGIRVFPNPTKEDLKIESKQFDITQFVLMDELGRILYEENDLPGSQSESISMETMPPGTYYLKLFTVDNPEGTVAKLVKM